MIFDDVRASTHFLMLSRQEMEWERVELSLRVSHIAVLRRAGPLGGAWQRPDQREWEWEGHRSRYVFNVASSPQSFPSISTGDIT